MTLDRLINFNSCNERILIITLQWSRYETFQEHVTPKIPIYSHYERLYIHSTGNVISVSIELMIRVGLRSFTLSESLKKGENRCHNVTAVMYTLND